VTIASPGNLFAIISIDLVKNMRNSKAHLEVRDDMEMNRDHESGVIYRTLLQRTAGISDTEDGTPYSENMNSEARQNYR
jgi:hypothetical protein